MSEEKNQNTEVEEKSTDQEVQLDKEKDTEAQVEETTPKNEGEQEEEVLFERDGKKYTAKDLETLEKKANDFEGILQKERLAKLNKAKKQEAKKDVEGGDSEKGDNEKTFSLEDVEKMVADKVNQALSNHNTNQFNENLQGAYSDFIKENPWANSDEVFNGIQEAFDPAGKTSKEDLVLRLKLAAQNAYPEQYLKFIEEKARGKAKLAEDAINAGDGAGGVGVKKEHKADAKSQLTKEEIEIADKLFDGDYEKYLKHRTP